MPARVAKLVKNTPKPAKLLSKNASKMPPTVPEIPSANASLAESSDAGPSLDVGALKVVAVTLFLFRHLEYAFGRSWQGALVCGQHFGWRKRARMRLNRHLGTGSDLPLSFRWRLFHAGKSANSSCLAATPSGGWTGCCSIAP